MTACGRKRHAGLLALCLRQHLALLVDFALKGILSRAYGKGQNQASSVTKISLQAGQGGGGGEMSARESTAWMAFKKLKAVTLIMGFPFYHQ